MSFPIASYIDHTLLKPASSLASFDLLCREAVENKFAAVCVPPYALRAAQDAIRGSGVKSCTVIGFPMGYSVLEAKVAEVETALREGADELDVVINLIALKSGQWEYLEKEMQRMVQLIHGDGKVIKVIIESGILTHEEIVQCCSLFGASVDFMKTSTGYAEKGATVEAVKLMRAHLPPSTQIKASGGIKTFAFAKELIDAGATRIGASASVAILAEANQAK